jgi:hypothetical protein
MNGLFDDVSEKLNELKESEQLDFNNDNDVIEAFFEVCHDVLDNYLIQEVKLHSYARSDCHYKNCLFYDREQQECTLYGDDIDKRIHLRWISANDCDRNPYLKKEYYRQCEYYTSAKEVKNQIRNDLGVI